MYSQGISPGLDFSNLSDTVALVCHCNDTQLPLRLPYTGELVFSAFAGTHQDAIKKGLDAQSARWAEVDRTGQGSKYWAMPYVPLDPKDLGYGYGNLIRVSSQSGKAGTAYIIKQAMLLDLPRRMQVSFYKVVQDWSEQTGKEMTAALITSAFKQAYHLDSNPAGRIYMHTYRLKPAKEPQSSPLSSDILFEKEPLVHFEGDFSIDGQRQIICGVGRGAVLAMLDAFRVDLCLELNIGESSEQIIEDNPTQPKSVTFIEMFLPGSSPEKSGVGSTWGIGISSDVITSRCRAVVSATNQLVGGGDLLKSTLTPSEIMASNVSGDGWVPWMKSHAGRFLSKRLGWLMVETS